MVTSSTTCMQAFLLLLVLLPIAQAANRDAQEGRQLQQVLALAGGIGGAGGGEDDGGRPGQARIGHRLKLIFPLIISIATRLGTLVPISIAILSGVIAMAMFANAAFTVSLASLALMLWDKLGKFNRPHVNDNVFHGNYYIPHIDHNINTAYWGSPRPDPQRTEIKSKKKKSR